MKILVIDGQGGKLGRALIEQIRILLPDSQIICVGTNSAATSNMLKGGASTGATGENAVAFCSADADIIAGPIGIVVADSLLGEITPRIALNVARSRAKKILIPFNKCGTVIAGVKDFTLTELIHECAEQIAREYKGQIAQEYDGRK